MGTQPTQTAIARSYMTPDSRRLMTDRLLSTRSGPGTIAGSLNDQIRFRVVGTGPFSSREIVPDSKLATELLKSPAGPHVLNQLKVAASSADQLWQKTRLEGFMLNRDNESVVAGQVLAGLERRDPDILKLATHVEQGRPNQAREAISLLHRQLKPSLARAGAWNSDGWIQFMPDTSRAILTAAGGYHPPKSEKGVRRARMADYINGNLTHEVQHSVTFPTEHAYTAKSKWVEEGTANVLSRTPVIHDRIERRTRVNPHQYAGRLAHKPKWTPDEWGPWKRPTVGSPKQQKKEQQQQQRNYGDSQPILRELVRMGGGGFDSNEKLATTRELLQGKSARFTPGVLADAIIRHNDLDPAVRERLRQRIISSVDTPGSIAAIRREFGIRD